MTWLARPCVVLLLRLGRVRLSQVQVVGNNWLELFSSILGSALATAQTAQAGLQMKINGAVLGNVGDTLDRDSLL